MVSSPGVATFGSRRGWKEDGWLPVATFGARRGRVEGWGEGLGSETDAASIDLLLALAWRSVDHVQEGSQVSNEVRTHAMVFERMRWCSWERFRTHAMVFWEEAIACFFWERFRTHAMVFLILLEEQQQLLTMFVRFGEDFGRELSGFGTEGGLFAMRMVWILWFDHL